MPTPETKTVYQEQQCQFDVPADVFRVWHGYKDRSSVQLRLEKEGQQVYLCDYRESRYPDKCVTATVSFDLFVEEWPKFIEFLAAKEAERAEVKAAEEKAAEVKAAEKEEALEETGTGDFRRG
jgi:hypothetical protein